MIKLRSMNGRRELELAIVGYESVKAHPQFDWYMVRALVSQRDKIFETVFPALETLDLPRLLEWFQTLADLRLPARPGIGFTEPNIEFEFLCWREGKYGISVILRDEMRPVFSSEDSEKALDDWRIVSELSSKDLLTIIRSIESTIEKYPNRGDAQESMERMKRHSQRDAFYRRMAEFHPDDVESLMAEGERKGILKLALRMREDGMAFETISNYTGLSIREICSLKA